MISTTPRTFFLALVLFSNFALADQRISKNKAIQIATDEILRVKGSELSSFETAIEENGQLVIVTFSGFGYGNKPAGVQYGGGLRITVDTELGVIVRREGLP